MGAGEPEEQGPGCTEGPGPYRERSPAAYLGLTLGLPWAYLGLTLEGVSRERLATSGGHRACCGQVSTHRGTHMNKQRGAYRLAFSQPATDDEEHYQHHHERCRDHRERRQREGHRIPPPAVAHTMRRGGCQQRR